MTTIISLDTIRELIRERDLSGLIEDGFIAYSADRVVVPPVGELLFTDPPGDTHIKYGYVKGAEHFVVKIASGFYHNRELGLPSNSGLMLVCSSRTGVPETILLDEGYLTDLRTALAGQIAARYLAPASVRAIGVLGTGVQARMQVEYLRAVTPCRDVVVWGRSRAHAERYLRDMETSGFSVVIADSPAAVAATANLIVTATPSSVPLLSAEDIMPGTHITAMGSDTPGKQELDGSVLHKADLIVADSISQCRERGEIASALRAGLIDEQDLMELGDIIARCRNGSAAGGARTAETQITVADLTGVAVQDIVIATAVCRAAQELNGMGQQ